MDTPNSHDSPQDGTGESAWGPQGLLRAMAAIDQVSIWTAELPPCLSFP